MSPCRHKLRTKKGKKVMMKCVVQHTHSVKEEKEEDQKMNAIFSVERKVATSAKVGCGFIRLRNSRRLKVLLSIASFFRPFNYNPFSLATGFALKPDIVNWRIDPKRADCYHP